MAFFFFRRAPLVRGALVRDGGSFPAEVLRGPADAARVLGRMIPVDAAREHFCVLALDTSNRLIAAQRTSVGSLNASLVHPREVFRFAILSAAASVIVGHNHPSGATEPSPDDVATTLSLRHAGSIVGIPVRDHVIIGSGQDQCSRFSSLVALGKIPPC